MMALMLTQAHVSNMSSSYHMGAAIAEDCMEAT